MGSDPISIYSFASLLAENESAGRQTRHRSQKPMHQNRNHRWDARLQIAIEKCAFHFEGALDRQKILLRGTEPTNKKSTQNNSTDGRHRIGKDNHDQRHDQLHFGRRVGG